MVGHIKGGSHLRKEDSARREGPLVERNSPSLSEEATFPNGWALIPLGEGSLRRRDGP